MSEYTGSQYDGEFNNGRMEGKGKFVFPSGTTYHGVMLDGEFHGEGVLVFKDCGRFTGTWERGVMLRGDYAFADGLAYDSRPDWNYCDGTDRAFYSERVEGLRPAGDEQLCNAHPPRPLPPGTFDIGRGYYDPSHKKVFSYDGELIGGLQPGETEAWAMGKCRFG